MTQHHRRSTHERRGGTYLCRGIYAKIAGLPFAQPGGILDSLGTKRDHLLLLGPRQRENHRRRFRHRQPPRRKRRSLEIEHEIGTAALEEPFIVLLMLPRQPAFRSQRFLLHVRADPPHGLFPRPRRQKLAHQRMLLGA